MTVEALQTALAAEHAAFYVYGASAPARPSRPSGRCSPRSLDAYATHRAWRDLLTRRLLDEGAEPTPAAPTYELPTMPATVLGVDPGGGGHRGPVRGDLRVRRREHRGRGPALGHLGAHPRSGAAGGVRQVSRALPRGGRPQSSRCVSARLRKSTRTAGSAIPSTPNPVNTVSSVVTTAPSSKTASERT